MSSVSLLARALVPEGIFLMGSAGRRDVEEPIHPVFVSAFEMALTPVTNSQYRAFLDSTERPPPPWFDDPNFRDPRQPVVGVDWEDASSYCRWLSEESGLSIRLPTEAEREKAARGGTPGVLYPWGDNPRGGDHDRISGPLPKPSCVASGRPNGYGLFNMADTVHEWCLDAYRPDFYKESPFANPCLRSGDRRVARGGSWRHQIVVTPCPARSTLPPSFRYPDFGFRWVCEPQ